MSSKSIIFPADIYEYEDKSALKIEFTAFIKVLILCFVTGMSLAGTVPEVEIVDLNGGNVPDVEIDTGGTIHVAYLSGHDIYYVRSTDEGASFSPPVRVNSEKGYASGGLFRGPDISLGVNGRVHISWYSDGYAQKRPKSEWGFMYSRLNDAGTAFETTRNLSGRPCDNYSLATDSTGNVAAIWVKDGLFISRSRDGGQSFDQAVKTDADPCECCATRSIFSKNGELYYLYRDKEDNQRDMYLGKVNNLNKPVKKTKLNNPSWYFEACPLSGSYLSWHNGQLLTAWELEGRIYIAQADQNGELSDPGAIKVADTGKYPVVLGLENGILAAWKRNTKLYWRFMDNNGGFTSVIHMAGTDSASRPAGTVTKSGKILLFP